jgi:hypothetical protein
VSWRSHLSTGHTHKPVTWESRRPWIFISPKPKPHPFQRLSNHPDDQCRQSLVVILASVSRTQKYFHGLSKWQTINHSSAEQTFNTYTWKGGVRFVQGMQRNCASGCFAEGTHLLWRRTMDHGTPESGDTGHENHGWTHEGMQPKPWQPETGGKKPLICNFSIYKLNWKKQTWEM